MAYRILRVIAVILARLTTRAKVIGRENIPPGPPYILVTNHLSAFDIPVLSSILPHHVRALAAIEHRSNPIYAPVLAASGAIWVRRGEVDRRAIREALDVLKRGEALGVAPEGTRADESHALQEAKAGAAYVATRADVPILPVGIAGTEKVKTSLLRLRRPEVQVAIGEPFHLPESGSVGSEKLLEYTEFIMRRIAELLPEQYRGVYARKTRQ
ncbi:MAG: lysophospholipid acyltransferase family protein [Anaerolineae bacterium]